MPGAAINKRVRPLREGGGRAWLGIAWRLVLTIGGGYATTSAVVAGLSIVLSRAGLQSSEAVVLASMLGFVVYLLLLLWGLSEQKPVRLVFGLSSLSLVAVAVLVLMPRLGG